MQGDGAGLRLGEEFHHNRVPVICSQISGVAPVAAAPLGRLPAGRTAMDLAASGRLRLTELITHTMPIERGAGGVQPAATSIRSRRSRSC